MLNNKQTNTPLSPTHTKTVSKGQGTHSCTLNAEATQSGWTEHRGTRGTSENKTKGFQGDDRSPLFFRSFPAPAGSGSPGQPRRLAAARETCAVLFKSSTFFAISIGRMGLPSPPRRLLMSAAPLLPHPPPQPKAHRSSAPTLRRAPARWLQTRGHARRSGIRTSGWDARGRRQLPPARPPAPAGASRGRGTREPQPRRSRAAAAAEASFSPSRDPERLGDRPEKRRKSCLPPGSTAVRAFCLKSQHLWLWLQRVLGDICLGKTGRKRGWGEVARLRSGFRGGSRG